jgi:hypothetical protein
VSRRRLLVVATARAPEAALRGELARLGYGDVDVKVVSPASDLSFGQWLTNAEDDARAEAEQIDEQTAKATEPHASTVEK